MLCLHGRALDGFLHPHPHPLRACKRQCTAVPAPGRRVWQVPSGCLYTPTPAPPPPTHTPVPHTHPCSPAGGNALLCLLLGVECGKHPAAILQPWLDAIRSKSSDILWSAEGITTYALIHDSSLPQKLKELFEGYDVTIIMALR